MAQYIDDDDAYAAALAPTFNPPEDPTQPQAPPTSGPTLVRRSATPAATTPSGNASSGAPPTTMASLPTAADRIQQLETQRDTVAGQAPDPTAAQYKPGLGTKIFRGLQGVTGGILRGGVLGGLAGGLGEDYSAPAGTYGKDLAKNQGALANIDSKISGDHAVLEAQNTQSEIDQRNNKAPDTVTTADGIKQWNPQTRKYDVAVGDAPKPKLAEGETPLGSSVDSLNKGMEDRYQQMHPGKTLPSEYQLGKDSTQKDFDRIDKLLTGTENAQATQAARDESTALRKQQMTQMAQFHAESMANAQANRDAIQSNKDKSGVLKAYSPVQDSAERMNIMTQNAEDALHGNQQAGLSLLSNHIGMTMGLVKGARINKEIYSEAAKSQPWLQGLKAHFSSDGYLDGVALSPPQIGNMVDLAPGRLSEDTKKARSQAKYLGATDDGPDRTPSRSTMRFYLFKAGGDKDKAKAAAAADGWSVDNAAK